MLKVDFSRQAHKFLKHVPPKHGQQLAEKVQQLRVDPQPQDSKPLKGKLADFLRADSGEYRIIYTVDEDVLQVFLIGKRNDDEVYRQLRRKLG